MIFYRYVVYLYRICTLCGTKFLVLSNIFHRLFALWTKVNNLEQCWTTSFGRTSAQCYAFISSYFQENLSALRTRVRSLQHKNRLLLWQMLKTGLQRAQANWTPERNQPRSKGERTSHPPWQELAINLWCCKTSSDVMNDSIQSPSAQWSWTPQIHGPHGPRCPGRPRAHLGNPRDTN